MEHRQFARIFQLTAIHAFVCLSLVCFDGACAEEVPLERFSLNPKEVCITLPVSIAGKRYDFLVVTAATHTCYSTDLRRHLGKPLVPPKAATAVGVGELPMFDAPHAMVGKLPLHGPGELVCCLDLQGRNWNLDTPIGGIIGMAFLRLHIVDLDFDEGTLALRRQLPDVKELKYTRIGLAVSRNGLPLVKCEVAGRRHVALLDTAYDYSGHLELSFAKRLIDAGAVGRSGAALIGGRKDSKFLHLVNSRFSMAKFEHSSLVFTVTSGTDLTDSSRIGVRYLRRFNVVLDFPQHNMYLRKSKSYNFWDDSHLYGMLLTRQGGRVLVHQVFAGSPAYALGIKKGDEVTSIDGVSTSKLSFLEATRRIGIRDKPLQLEVLREGTKRAVSFPRP